MERNVRECLHVKAAWTALSSLTPPVPNECFNHDFIKCYCNNCCELRMRRDGNGSVPIGYTRFATYVEPNHCELRGVFLNWPKCFHGTFHNRVAAIVTTKYLLFPGATTFDGKVLGIRDGHIKKEGIKRGTNFDTIRDGRIGNVSKVHTTAGKFYENFDPTTCAFLSNHYGYAEHEIYAEKKELAGLETTILLEFRLQPNTFDEASHTFSPLSLGQCSPNRFSKPNSTWEWFTNRYGVMKITGILVKISKKSLLKKLTPKEIPPPSISSIPKLFPPVARPNFLKFLSCQTAFQRYEVLLQSGVSRNIINEEYCRCYCSLCEPTQSPPYKRGEKTYCLPCPFTKFALYVDSTVKREVFKKWPVAYHGTTFHNFTNIVNTGMFVPAGARGPDGKLVMNRDEDKLREGRSAKSYVEDSIYFTPLLSYAAHPVHASLCDVLHKGSPLKVSVVLQLRVRPGCYKTGPSTIVNYIVPSQEKEYVGSEEWFTERHGCIVLTGVLMSTTQ